MPTTKRMTGRLKDPVLGVTRYDLVSSFLMAVLLGLAVIVVWLVALWLTNQIPKVEPNLKLEWVQDPGGDPFGAVDETLLLKSPEEVTDDPSIPDIEVEETEAVKTIESVIENSDHPSQQVPKLLQESSSELGKPGSAPGTGRKVKGLDPGPGGFGQKQRWLVRFSDRGTLDLYARQLDFFGIELGLWQTSGKIVYASNFTGDAVKTRTVETGKGEKRLYFSWKGGGRKKADVSLLRTAGLDGKSGIILHFYPKQTEQMLRRLELGYKGRPLQEIVQTVFAVLHQGDGFRFVVSKQRYNR